MSGTDGVYGPADAPLSIGDVFVGRRWWVGGSGRRPTSFLQAVRFTPRRVFCVALQEQVLEEFNGGRRSQDGYWIVIPKVLSPEELAEEAKSHRGQVLCMIRRHAWPTPVPGPFLPNQVRLRNPRAVDYDYHFWDGTPQMTN